MSTYFAPILYKTDAAGIPDLSKAKTYTTQESEMEFIDKWEEIANRCPLRFLANGDVVTPDNAHLYNFHTDPGVKAASKREPRPAEPRVEMTPELRAFEKELERIKLEQDWIRAFDERFGEGIPPEIYNLIGELSAEELEKRGEQAEQQEK